MKYRPSGTRPHNGDRCQPPQSSPMAEPPAAVRHPSPVGGAEGPQNGRESSPGVTWWAPRRGAKRRDGTGRATAPPRGATAAWAGSGTAAPLSEETSAAPGAWRSGARAQHGTVAPRRGPWQSLPGAPQRGGTRGPPASPPAAPEAREPDALTRRRRPAPPSRGGGAQGRGAPRGGRQPPIGAGRVMRPRPLPPGTANRMAGKGVGRECGRAGSVGAPARAAVRRRPRLVAVQRRRQQRPLPPRAQRPVA